MRETLREEEFNIVKHYDTLDNTKKSFSLQPKLRTQIIPGLIFLRGFEYYRGV
jgi:hypothetical protein